MQLRLFVGKRAHVSGFGKGKEVDASSVRIYRNAGREEGDPVRLKKRDKRGTRTEAVTWSRIVCEGYAKGKGTWNLVPSN